MKRLCALALICVLVGGMLMTLIGCNKEPEEKPAPPSVTQSSPVKSPAKNSMTGSAGP